MSTKKKLLEAAAGNAGKAVYVDDVFSTYLYEGTSAVGNVVTNGIDLAGEGGLVWLKSRGDAQSHGLFDTERGAGKMLQSNATAAELPYTDVSSFNSDGFTAGFYSGWFNSSSYEQCSWTFRKAPKFFDVVTYTGNGTTQNISHNLGSVPGCIIVKKYNGAAGWCVYHRSIGNTEALFLNSTLGTGTWVGSEFWNNTTPTSTQFSVGGNDAVNNSGGVTYVAYLFAHNDGDGEFGEDSDQDIINCGSYTGNGSTDGPEIDLGFEPQWVMIKNSSNAGDWMMFDVMRGWSQGGSDNNARLYANLSSQESATTDRYRIQANGFKVTTSTAAYNNSGDTYIYVAIRRPMKTPESGTEVFGVNSYSETNDYQQLTTGNLVDLGWQYLNSDGAKFFTRLLGQGYLNPTSTAAANTSAASAFDFMDGFEPHYANTVSGFSPRVVYGFTRATGFFDVVTYAGNDTHGRTISHNLGSVPGMIIIKSTSNAEDWYVYHRGVDSTAPEDYTLNLHNNGARVDENQMLYDTAPTSTEFTVAGFDATNGVGKTYVAYLFATLPGISKVGSYSGTGSDVNVDCGFSSGARFVLVKRTDSTGDWYLWDSERGIVAGNDPYLFLNSTAAEVTSTDYIDPLSSGFTVTSSAPAALNASGGNYIFLAIA